MIKKVFVILCVACCAHVVSAQVDFFNSADAFFAKHVDAKGMVDYKTIKSNQAGLNRLVFSIARANYERYDANTKKAFLINAYNILVIREIVDLMPIKGPLENSAFFNGIKQNVGGKDMTLDELEKSVLAKEFPDPRLHFVLVCGAMGCPPLAQFAYRPDGLDKKLDERTRFVLNLDWFVREKGNAVEYSQIFEWYRSDFEKNGMTLKTYVNQYRTDKFRSNNQTFYTYDWNLNIQR